MTTIRSFVERLHKIGVRVELVGNFPWVYLDKVNGKKVVEKLHANHGFTVFFCAIETGQHDKITDIDLIFKTIRKYL